MVDVVVYLDDIVIFGNEKEVVWKNTLAVLKELVQAGFMINVNKCQFLTNNIDAVGFEVQ